ncbi:MAG TPA: S1 RNA-binding domain-containing protein, partial [Dissulfurispiraceae bacterium]|nr:S1 RNA-binding domain-containing protein [Dissulfurispiraceae bacterium]
MDTQTTDETKDFEKIYGETLHRVARGDISKGRVIAVRNDGVVVDIGYKSEGIVSLSEFEAEEIAALKEGDELEVFVERINDQEGVVTVSRDRASRIRAWETLTAAHATNREVQGTVIDKTKGGLLVSVMGMRAFLPSSQIDLKVIKDLDSYVGQTMAMKILKLMPPKLSQETPGGKVSGTSLIVSRRAIVEEARHKKKEETLRGLHEGAVLKGLVKNITDYGVFVDL